MAEVRRGVLPGALGLLVMSAMQAGAAAWPRAEGQSFLSYSYQFQINETTDRNYSSLYYEHGVTERLTFGIDAGRSDGSGDLTGLLFLRNPLLSTDAGTWISAELAVGAIEIEDEIYGVLRPGLSWGRGFETGLGSAWAGVESTYAFRGDGSEEGKIDATVGLNHASGSLSLVQLQYAAPTGGDDSLSIAPSHVIDLNRGLFLELGGAYKFTNEAASLKIGLWSEF
ncbi:hypothetical protein [Salipiger bermudensis]|uniref:hypothetical protein n=1 Tax=Salipiger bermudensis TaxID=344736 RepID=UPI001CD4A6CB|nr:hypothetical protein [Salipiger bermudensis]MCA0961748.1 hypothetical protein [Salipiger bermudensis]